MILTSPVRYTIFDLEVPYNRVPLIQIYSDSMAYGTVEMKLPLTAAAVTAQVYLVTAPTSSEDRWIRASADIYPGNPDVLSWQTTLLDDGYYQISWQFAPTAITALDGQNYSIEFFVNYTPSATVAQSAPKIIVKIHDEIIT